MGEPQGSPFFVQILCGTWRRLGSRGSGPYRLATPSAPPPLKYFFVPLPCKKARGGQWHGSNDNVPDRGGKLSESTGG